MTWLPIGAGVALGAAMLLLAAFFATQDRRLDRLAEWSFVVFAILGVPTALMLLDRMSGAGLAGQAVAALGVVAIAVIGLGELGVTLGLADFRRMGPVLTLAFAGVLAWVLGASAIGLEGGSLPAGLAWLGILSVLAMGVLLLLILRIPGAIRGDVEPPRGLMTAVAVPLVGVVGWFVWLGLGLA